MLRRAFASLVRKGFDRLALPHFERIRAELKSNSGVASAPQVPPGITFTNTSAKFCPLGGTAGEFLVPGVATRSSEDPLPVPPIELWQGYAQTEAGFLEFGREDVAMLLRTLEEAGAKTAALDRVLDFGCGAARVLRFLPRNPGTSEFWGVDVNASMITWCQQHLSPPLFFATSTTAPHLPFEDNYFDLVYAFSVFTHISDLADAWLLELRRVLRKGGYALITILDESTLAKMPTIYRDEPAYVEYVAGVQAFLARKLAPGQDYAWFSFGADMDAQVFYDQKWLLSKWSRLMRVLSVAEGAHGPHTVILLQK